MSKSKKILKITGYIFAGLCILLILAELSLRFILPFESVKSKTLAYISQKIGAEVKVGNIKAGLFRIKLNDVSLDTNQSSLFNCKHLQLKLNPFKLLIGQLYIRTAVVVEPSINIVRNQDGSFNFDPLVAAEEKLQENPPSAEKLSVPFDIRIKNFSLTDGQISFTDLKDNIKANLQNLNFNLHKFSFYKPFNFHISFEPYFEQNNIIFNGAHIALDAEANFNKFNLEHAFFNLKSFLINYKNTVFKTEAQINNFVNMSGHISTELKDFSHETLADFIEVLPFNIPSVTSYISFDYSMQNSKANIKNLNVKLADTELNLKANIDLNKNTVSEGKINLISVLDSLKDLSPHLEELKPTGKINADFDFAWPLVLTGNLSLADIGLTTDKAGVLESLNTNIKIKSVDEINIDTLSGILNKNPFTMQAHYLKHKDFADVFFDFKADKLYVFNTSQKGTKQENKTEAINQITEEKQLSDENSQTNIQAFSFVPINVDAKVDIKKIDAPFIKGNNLVFTAKAKNITVQLNQVHGIFDLSIEKGQIKDIYRISNANSITKVMFMSLGIVSKVVNTLNVLDLLNGMGKILTGNPKEEEEIPVHQEINGKMDFDSFKTKVDFNEGFATMKRCAFVSGLFSFRVKGNINFDNRKIKLNVESAPGRHTENGIMPLNIDIKGTIENPKGSLSVISSVGELVSNTVTNNPVSNMLKSGWGALFKPKTEEELNNISNPENNKPGNVN